MCRRVLTLSFVAAAAACAHQDQISVADHRELARQDESRANEAEARAHALGPLSERSPILYHGIVEQPFASIAAPQLVLQHEAEAARLHAVEHEKAAAALEQFEDEGCRGIEPAARRACPLLAPYVSKVVETAHGLQLFFRAGAPIQELNQRMQCHLAFARARAYRDIPSCPLYAPGVRLTLDHNNQSVDLSVSGATEASELRERARREFGAVTRAPHVDE